MITICIEKLVIVLSTDIIFEDKSLIFENNVGLLLLRNKPLKLVSKFKSLME